MSLHRSLKGSSKIQLKRNVMKRYERVDALKKEGRLQEGEGVLGLPKTKVDS
jgi:small basic protein (TIGR04137 family)